MPPPNVHTTSANPTEPECSRTPLGEMKIPEPMMLPAEKKAVMLYCHDSQNVVGDPQGSVTYRQRDCNFKISISNDIMMVDINRQPLLI